MTADETPATIALFAQHAELINASGIDPQVAQARKYRSADTKAQLERHGFATYQRRVPGLIIPMFGPDGTVSGYQYRPDEPRVRKGKPVKYETPQGQSLRLDCHPNITAQLGDPSIDLWVTEGARKADAAISHGLCCVALSGVWAWRGTNSKGGSTALADWEQVALKGRRVVLAFDSDVVEKPSVRNALRRLAAFLDSRGATVVAVRIPPGPTGDDGEPIKVGLDDWFVAGGTVDGLTEHVDPGLLGVVDEDEANLSKKLIELAQDLWTFGRTTGGENYCHPIGAHVAQLERETNLARDLGVAWFEANGSVPSRSTLADVCSLVWGLSGRDADPTELHLRVGTLPGRVVLDLADQSNRAVVIDADGWRVTTEPGILFRRSRLTQALPEPERVGLGGLAGLRACLNVSDDDWALVLGWLAFGLVRPNAPHPILAMRGEQGTGKTTAARLLTRVLDPSPSAVRRAPEDEANWRTSLAGSRFVVFDNVSWIKPWLADAMCRAVTGDAEVTRQLYTDDALIVHELRRTLVVTTIDAAFIRGDLADRTLPVDLGVISGAERRTDDAVLNQFDRVWPEVLGGLLELASTVMAEIDSVTLAESPRMADFALVLATMDQVLGTKALPYYLTRLDSMAADIVEANPVANAVMKFMAGRDEWEGSATSLLMLLTPAGMFVGGASGSAWPKDGAGLSRALTRQGQALRSQGVVVEMVRNMSARSIRLTRVVESHDAFHDAFQTKRVMDLEGVTWEDENHDAMTRFPGETDFEIDGRVSRVAGRETNPQVTGTDESRDTATHQNAQVSRENASSRHGEVIHNPDGSETWT